ncbi:MAG: DUF4190 domain-containing protein [Saprospiraceae bacterium]
MRASSYLGPIILFLSFLSTQTSLQGMDLAQTQQSFNLTEQIDELNLVSEKVFQVKKGVFKKHATKKALRRALRSDPQTQKTHNLAIWCFVLGLACLISWLFSPLLVFLFGFGAMLTGVIAKDKIRQNPEKYKGDSLAWIGILLGGVSVIVLLAIGIPQIGGG